MDRSIARPGVNAVAVGAANAMPQPVRRANTVAPRAAANSSRSKDERRGSLSIDATVARRIERTRRVGRRVDPPRKAFHAAIEHRGRGHPRAAAADDHHVGVPAPDDHRGLDQRLQTRGVPLADCVVWPARIVSDADMAGRHVGQIHQHPQRIQFRHADLTPLLRLKLAVLGAMGVGRHGLRRLAVQHVASEQHARAVRRQLVGPQPRVLDRHARGGEPHLDLAGHDLQRLARFDVLLGVEILDRGPDPQGQIQPFHSRQDIHTAPLLLE
jgi:hypothetical protein